MLFLHIFYFYGQQLAEYQSRLQRVARFFRMHMHLDNVVVVHQNHAVADAFQIAAKLLRVFLAFKVASHDKFGAIGKVDDLIEFRGGVSEKVGFSRLLLGGVRLVQNDGTVLKYAQHSVQNITESFSSGIDYSRLFQYGQQFRCFFQCFGSALANRAPYINDVIVDGCRRLALFAGNAGNGQDGSLRRLHHGLIRGLHANTQSVGQIGAADFFHSLNPLGEAAEQNGEDDPGVAPCAVEHGGSCGARDFACAAVGIF